MGGNGCFVEPAITARVHKPGEKLGIVAVARGLAEQAHERPLCLTDVGLEVGVELWATVMPRVDLEGSTERILGAHFAIGGGLSMNLPMTR